MPSQWRGWISPSGKRFTTTPNVDHNEHADRLLSRRYKGWRWENDKRFCFGDGAYYAMSALEYKGWIRVVCSGSYSVWTLDRRRKEMLIDLTLDRADDDPLYLDVEDKRCRRPRYIWELRNGRRRSYATPTS